jgi:hypothetical protein
MTGARKGADWSINVLGCATAPASHTSPGNSTCAPLPGPEHQNIKTALTALCAFLYSQAEHQPCQSHRHRLLTPQPAPQQLNRHSSPPTHAERKVCARATGREQLG